jgi:signal transduction histidine kinase
LKALAATADELGGGNLSARIAPGPPDAIGHLARTFNGMAERIERLVGAHQELLRMVSHELRTPMQRVHFSVEEVRAAATAADRDRALERIAGDLEKLDELIEELLGYVRLKDSAPTAAAPVDLAPVLEAVTRDLSPLAPGVALVLVLPQDRALRAAIPPRLLHRALSNLVTNAQAYGHGRVRLSAAVDGGRVVIDVDDDGPGVPEADRDRVFEPFQRLDDGAERKRGFGLGLTIVRRIAELHGGTVGVTTSPLGGARFRFELPAAA